MSEPVSSTPAIPPGQHHRSGRLELEILATCMNSGEMILRFQVLDSLKPLPSYKQTGAEPQTKTRQTFGRQRVPNSARDQLQNDDRPAQVVGRAQRARPHPQQRRGTDLQAKLDKRKARSVCQPCGQTGHWAGDPQCPGRPVNVIELEDKVQEFERNQDAGMRQVLSVQVDVSHVRLLRPSTRLVLAMNSMDVGRREGARGVIDTAARYTVAGRAWDRAYRQICAERGIGWDTDAC